MLTTLALVQCLSIAAPQPVTFAVPGQAFLTGGGKFEMEGQQNNYNAAGDTHADDYGHVVVEIGSGAFATQGLALGGNMSMDTYFGDVTHLQKFSIGPVISYALPVTQNVYWWPKLSGGFSARTFGSARTRGGHVEFDPSVLLAATSNFGVNIGPYARYTLLDAGNDKTHTELAYGLRVGFTLWTDGPKARR